MILLFALHLSCSLHGLPGDECIAVAQVESGLTVDARNGAHLGAMQVRHDLTPWPEWALTTAVGGAMAGARALEAWHRIGGARYLRGYATGCTGADGRKPCLRSNGSVNWPRVRAGQRYERKVTAILKMLGRRNRIS